MKVEVVAEVAGKYADLGLETIADGNARIGTHRRSLQQHWQ